MAKYNEILTGRHNRFMQKLFGMKGAAPAPQLSGDVQVVHPIFHGVENRYIESWNEFWTTQVSGAQAAINSAVRLRNPLTSNVIAVIEKATVAAAAANAITLSWTHSGITGDTTNVGVGLPRDFRWAASGVGNSALVPSTSVGATVDLTLIVWNQQTDANGLSELILFDDQEITLLPGDTLQWRNATVNAALRLSVMWRERALEDSEQK